jgi:hypothetical protein
MISPECTFLLNVLFQPCLLIYDFNGWSILEDFYGQSDVFNVTLFGPYIYCDKINTRQLSQDPIQSNNVVSTMAGPR